MRIDKSAVWATIGVMLLLWCVPLTAEAQLYRYKDTQGNWRYTDNLADVPVAQREDCKKYESIEETAVQPATSSKGQGDDEGAASPEDADSLRDELKERKVALDKEYEDLVDESDALQKLSLNLKTTEVKEEFNRRKDAFNQRVNTFEERRKVFEVDLQAYNDIAGSK